MALEDLPRYNVAIAMCMWQLPWLYTLPLVKVLKLWPASRTLANRLLSQIQTSPVLDLVSGHEA